MTERNVISVCVNNGIGVLGRVTGLFSRRGYNIISLNVAETENLGISRMTIVADGDGTAVFVADAVRVYTA